MLEQIFKSTITNYTADEKLRDDLWNEVFTRYSEKGRHYHNLNHLDSMMTELQGIKVHVADWDVVVLAVFYHDIIYSATASNNEENSVVLAGFRLNELALPESRIKHCEKMILATKGHAVSDDADTNFFTDADLSILGKSWDVYQAYFQNVRKEYAFYPDLLYKPGRRKVLDHFLGMSKIFKTKHFTDLYEAQARENLQRERTLL